MAGFAINEAKPTAMDEMAMRRAIERKRDGEILSGHEWDEIIAGYMDGIVDDAQMAALAMACVWRGLTIHETAALTRAMVSSGQVLQYPAGTIVVDKHSSGGVSDIVSLVAVPLVAACGVRVAKLSGRALGHTGGTIDKLETIPGYNVALSMEAFTEQVLRVGCAIAAQTEAFVPADKRLYRLRDRTGTVPSVGLIAGSIVSKKVAGGAHAFVFDVKCGTAAFMQNHHEGIELAQALVDTSREFGRRAHAIVSDMNEPLGRSIGTGIEVIEARDFLRGRIQDARIREQCMHIASAMLELADVADPRNAATRALESGAAYEKLVELVEAQGSSLAALEALSLPAEMQALRADREGYVKRIDGVMLGNAGREWSTRVPTGGVRLAVRVGDRVATGDVLAECFGADARPADIASAFTVSTDAPPQRPLVYATI